MQKRSRNITKFRNNEQAWKLAEWMFDVCIVSGDSGFNDYQEWYKNRLYDAAESMIERVGFTTLSRLYDV